MSIPRGLAVKAAVRKCTDIRLGEGAGREPDRAAREWFFTLDQRQKMAELGAPANLDEAEDLAETTDEKLHLAEIIRLRGRLGQAEGDHDQARLCFERAIACSRNQRARLFELNAARDRAKLEAEAGDATKALATLRTIVDWFPATLEFPALDECRALLQ